MMYEFNLRALNMICDENPFNTGMFYKLKVSFNMGTFSESWHTRPGTYSRE